MKLNPDCIRDILFVVEENATFSDDVQEETLYQKLIPKYSQEEILYHVRQCEHSGLFLKVNHFLAGSLFKIYHHTDISLLTILDKRIIGIRLSKLQAKLAHHL